MSQVIDNTKVLNELAAIKTQVSEIDDNFGTKSGGSEWKVSAEWKNSSKEFPGEYRINSQLSLPEKFDATEHIQRLSNDISSKKLVEVTKALKEVIAK